MRVVRQGLPLAIITIENKKAVIGRGCVECRTCFKVCPKQAVMEVITPVPGAVVCGSCPVGCQVPEGGRGPVIGTSTKTGPWSGPGRC